MRRDDPHGRLIMYDLDHDSAPVTMAGQINHGACGDMQHRVQKQDRTQKSVALRPPAQGRVLMGIDQPGRSTDPVQIKDPGMWRACAVSLLQGQHMVLPFGADIRGNHVSDAVRVNTSVASTRAVDVPGGTSDQRQQADLSVKYSALIRAHAGK